MRKVKFRISPILFKQVMHIPDECTISDISVLHNTAFGDISVEVVIPGAIGENETCETIETIPIIHYDNVNDIYTWDWNLP